jgi:hypothetical protein
VNKIQSLQIGLVLSILNKIVMIKLQELTPFFNIIAHFNSVNRKNKKGINLINKDLYQCVPQLSYFRNKH